MPLFNLLFVGTTAVVSGCSVYQSPGRECIEKRSCLQTYVSSLESFSPSDFCVTAEPIDQKALGAPILLPEILASYGLNGYKKNFSDNSRQLTISTADNSVFCSFLFIDEPTELRLDSQAHELSLEFLLTRQLPTTPRTAP